MKNKQKLLDELNKDFDNVAYNYDDRMSAVEMLEGLEERMIRRLIEIVDLIDDKKE